MRKLTNKPPHNLKAPGEAAFNWLFKNYKNRAKQRQIEFVLSKEEFRKLTSSICAYCGQTPNNSFGAKRLNGFYLYNGVDRVDNSIGYLIENCVACCKTCNYMKQDMSKKDFLDHVKAIISYHTV